MKSLKKLFHLSTCSTCVRILKEWNVVDSVVLQDIKQQLYTAEELDYMKSIVGSYEELFSKRAVKYKEWNVKEQIKSDDDYRSFLLKDYTFLKRPVLLYEGHVFAGNSKKNVEDVLCFLDKK